MVPPQNPFRKASVPVTGKPEPGEIPQETLPALQQEPETEPSQVPAVISTSYLVESLGDASSLTPEQVEGLNQYMVKARLGISTQIAPLICNDNCPFKGKCPIVQNKIPLPFGKPCPVETSVMQQYRDELGLSLGIDAAAVGAAFDRKLLDDLAFIHMVKMRLGIEMSSTDVDVAKERVVGYSPQGAPIHGTVLNPRLGVLEKLMKLEKQIMSELMATRRAKFQASGNPDDASQVGASLMGKMEEAMKRKITEAQAKNEKEVEEIIDAEFTIKD